MDMFDSNSSYPMLKLALDGLEQRHGVLANNVANMHTPGFQARELDFRHVLNHMNETSLTDLPLTTSSDMHMAGPASSANPWSNATSATGHAPDMQEQMVKVSENSLQFSAIAQAVSQHIARYKSVLSEGRQV